MFKLVLAAIFIGSTASATIEKSTLEPAHQLVIEDAIYKRCGLSGRVIQVQHTARPHRIDGGILDYTYTTVFVVRVGLDQYDFDEHQVVVESAYADHYNHELKEWGAYSVTSLSTPNRSCP